MKRRPKKRNRRILGIVLLAIASILIMAVVAGTTDLGQIVVNSSQGRCTVGTDSSVKCQLGTLKKGSSATIEITVHPNNAGTLVNTATVSSSKVDPDKSNNTATEKTVVVAPSADIAITKMDNPDPVKLGEALTYTVTVTNQGPDSATNVILVDSTKQMEDEESGADDGDSDD